MIIISNTTPIITLLKVHKLEILKELFKEVYISKGVYDELVINNSFLDEAKVIRECNFIKVTSINNEFAVRLLQKNLGLDIGESESIVLCDELKGNMLIIDERKGRAVAKSMAIDLTGTLGILLRAKEQGIINKIKPLLDKMIEKDIRISAKLYEDILKMAKEN